MSRFIFIIYFRPNNFPYDNPVGAVIFNMIKDIARIYLLYELTSQNRFMRTNDDGTFRYVIETRGLGFLLDFLTCYILRYQDEECLCLRHGFDQFKQKHALKF